MRVGAVHVDRVNRFAIEIDEDPVGPSSLPVTNTKVDYTECNEVDPATFDLFRADPGLALGFVEQARNRQLGHLLLFGPGLLNGGLATASRRECDSTRPGRGASSEGSRTNDEISYSSAHGTLHRAHAHDRENCSSPRG
jgi:hypothetical protein